MTLTTENPNPLETYRDRQIILAYFNQLATILGEPSVESMLEISNLMVHVRYALGQYIKDYPIQGPDGVR